MKKICVIGVGTMGSGIAAQIANSKTQVLLLDIVDEVSDDPSNIANMALKKMLQTKPYPLSHPSLIKYIHTGNLRDNLNLISGCDLIIEAIVEKIEIKHKLYNSLVPHLKKDAIIASNTSTLPLKVLKEKLPEHIGNRFFITHFFNPPRYMQLLELVYNHKTDANAVKLVSDFMHDYLGKTIIKCNDTPGFIANRVGCYLLELSMREAIKLKLNPFTVDKIFTEILGFPSTGIFGLYDLIGHDVMKLISNSLIQALPKNDDYHNIYTDCKELSLLNEKGALGRKAGMGFYKMNKIDGKNQKQQIDFESMKYQDVKKVTIAKTIDALYEKNDQYSLFFKTILSRFFTYLVNLIPEISDDINDVDEAMKLGYSLKFGFFELLKNKIPNGQEFLNKLDGKYLNKEKKQSSWRDKARTILSNDDAMLLEYKNQHIFVIKTKMNCLSIEVFNLLIKSIKCTEDKYSKLIIYPCNNKNFSVGADIKFISEKIQKKQFAEIEAFIELGQKAMLELKHSNRPVISCAAGFALGGGAELLLHSDYVFAHQNLSAGLVELGVGLIPAFGGIKEIFLRSNGNKNVLIHNLKNILNQYKTSSGDYFAEEFNTNCQVNMNVDNILTEAMELKSIDQSKIVTSVTLPVIKLNQEIDSKDFDDLQLNILAFFQKIIDQKTVTEEQLLQYEKEKFMELVRHPLCSERLSKFV